MMPLSARQSAIECFFAPRQVAIVGASADPRKWGYMAAEQALRDSAGRDVLLVNSRGGDVLGQRCRSSIAELPDGIDLAVVTLPPSAFEGAVEQLLVKGTRAIVAITAGFGEAGSAGRDVEARIVERVRAAGSVLAGPNCMGVFDGHTPFRCMPWAEIKAGPIGFVSQSGGLIMDLSLRLAEHGLGLSRAVSIGNQADVGIAEFATNLGSHPTTEVIALYGESFAGGRDIFRCIERIVTAGKPVVMLSPDSNAAAARAARSHTASLVTQRRVVEAAARDAGAHYVRTVREMAELLVTLASGQRGRGRRTFVLTDTGGPGVLLAGDVERAGLEMPMPSAGLRDAIAAGLTPRAVVGNPIDLVDNLDVEPAVTALQALVDSDEVDAVLMNLHAFVHDTPALEADAGRRLAEVARKSGKPVAVSSRIFDTPGIRALAAARIPVFRDGEAAARSLALLCAPAVDKPRGLLHVLDGRGRDAVKAGDYLSARRLFRGAGIPLPTLRVAVDATDARRIAEEIGYPVALKAVEVSRKTDVGGVSLFIDDAAQLDGEWRSMTAALPASALAVEEMVQLRSGVELLVAVHRDAQLGPVLVLGQGGIHADRLDDITVDLVPLGPREVEAALARLEIAPRLLGTRGQRGIHVGAVARVAIALADLAMAHPELEVLEINPLLANPRECIALDARIVLGPTTSATSAAQ